jgi:hypothetical protein
VVLLPESIDFSSCLLHQNRFLVVVQDDHIEIDVGAGDLFDKSCQSCDPNVNPLLKPGNAVLGNENSGRA